MPICVESDRPPCYYRMLLKQLPVRVTARRTVEEFALSVSPTTFSMSRPAFFALPFALCLMGFAILPALAQDKTTPPATDPVVKNPVPKEPAREKTAETPPAPPAVAAGTLPTTLTLSEAIEYALRLQPNIAAAVANREQSAQRRLQTQSRYYPRLTPSYSNVSQYNYGTTTVRTTTGTGTTGTGTTGTGTTGTGTTGTGTTGTGTTGTGTTGTGTTGTGTDTTTQQTFVNEFVGTTTTTRQAQVALSFNLFDAGTRELAARQARQNLRASEYNETNTRQTVIAGVADAYFSVLRNQALVRVAEAQVARAQNTRDVVKAQADVGITAQKDTFQAEADLLNAQVNLLQAQNNLAVAQATLKQQIGVVGGDTLQLADVVLPDITTPITATPAPPKTPAANGTTAASPTGQGVQAGQDVALINSLAETAYQTRPDIAASRQNVESSRTTSSLARVDAGVQYSGDIAATQRINADEFNRQAGNNRQIGVTASYPLFDGGNVRSAFRAAQAGARSSEANLNALRLQVSLDVEQNYRTLAQARATLPASASAVRAAQINYDAAIASFREGVGTIVEIITAQTSLVQAQTNYVQSIYNFYAADARLTRAVGQVDKISRIGSTAPTNAPPVQIAPVPNASLTPTP